MVWRANPVLVQELRSRMRGARAFVIITLTLLAFTLVCGLIYLVEISLYSGPYYYGYGYGPSPSFNVSRSADLGRTFFGVLAVGGTLVVSVLVPAVGAGTISGEAERKTLDLLLVTPLKTHTILWGKLVSVGIYVGLVVLATIPLASLSLLFGGVSAGTMLQALGLLVLFIVAFSAMSLFCSVAFSRAGWARGVALGISAFLLGGTLLWFGTAGTLVTWRASGDEILWFLVPNPVAAIADLLSPDMSSSITVPLRAYTAVEYAFWAGLLYLGAWALLRYRRAGAGRGRSHLPTWATIAAAGLLTVGWAWGLPVFLALLGPPP